MTRKKNGYKKLLNRVSIILEDDPQDIIDEEQGVIYAGGFWELVHPRILNDDDTSLSDSLKEEIIDNPRKIGSANLMYVQDLIEKYCERNPSIVKKTSNVVSLEECVKTFTSRILNDLVEEKIVRIMPHIKREQSIKLVVDNTRKETANVGT